MLRSTVLGSLLCIALLTSACGTSGDASNSSSDGASTKADFIKRADQICESTDKAQIAAIEAFTAKRPGANRTKSLKEGIVVVGLPPVRAEVEKLGSLLVPEGDEGEVQAILDEVEEAIEKGEDDPSTMVDGSIGPFAAAGKLAREYGFKACAFPL